MADRVAFNAVELDALWGLPWLPQMIYMRAIRPNMDYATGVVGIRTSRTKRISYQAIREQVEVHETQGRNGSEQVSMSALRNAVSTLVRVGVIARVTGHGDRSACLVFRCLLADVDQSVQNKYDRGTTGSATEVRQEVQHRHDTPKTSHISASKPLDVEAATEQSGEVRQSSPEKCDTPPDTDLKTNTTTARVREAELIPAGFCLDEPVRARLLLAGVRPVVAQYFLQEFVNDCESKGKTSFSWAAEFAVYCKKWEWRYDKEQSNNLEESGNSYRQRRPSRASTVHEREKRLYEEAVARESGAENIHTVEGAVRPQVVIPYRGRRDS